MRRALTLNNFVQKVERVALGTLATAALAACGTQLPQAPPLAEELVIHCLLVSDAAEQRLLLTKVLERANDSLPSVTDAVVEVNGVRFTSIPTDRSNPHDPFNWIAAGLKLQCGQICSLRVFYQGRIIQGRTSMPRLDPVTIHGDTISWSGEAISHKYAVWLNDIHFTVIEKPQLILRENYSLPLPTGRYRLRIMAHDDNYVQAQETRVSSLGLQGAYGLFASACAWEDSVDLK